MNNHRTEEKDVERKIKKYEKHFDIEITDTNTTREKDINTIANTIIFHVLETTSYSYPSRVGENRRHPA